MNHNIPVQSLIGHIKTAIDVDPWAKEMAEELLKKQEPVKPREEKCGRHWDLDVWTYVCGECGSAIDTVDVYCRHCGREVKWDA